MEEIRKNAVNCNAVNTMKADKEEKKMTADIRKNFRKAVVLSSIAAMLAGCGGTASGQFETFTDEEDDTAAVVAAEPTSTPEAKDDKPDEDKHFTIGEVDHSKDKKDTDTKDSTVHPVNGDKGNKTGGKTGTEKGTDNSSSETGNSSNTSGTHTGTSVIPSGGNNNNSGTGSTDNTGTGGDFQPVNTPSPTAAPSNTPAPTSTPTESPVQPAPAQDANEELDRAKQELTDAEAALQAAQENNDAAQQNAADRQNELDAAIAEQEAAQAKLDELNNQTPAESQYDVSLGTLGFFEYMSDSDEAGYEAAREVLDYASSDSVTEGARTNIGADNDATSLENGMKAIRYLEECNEIRERDGLQPLTVTLEMMAIAEANANASSYYQGHWSMENSSESLMAHGWRTAENWAGAYNAVSDDVNHLNSWDPFHGWYDEEKAIYDSGDTDFTRTGHYQNIVNTSYDVTGIGIASKGRWNPNTVQDFNFDSNGQKTYTVAEYKELYNTYYQEALNSNGSGENQEALEAAQAELDAANQKVTDAQNALDEAKAQAEAAAQALEEAQQNYDARNQALDNLADNTALEESEQKLKEAQQNDEQAKKEVENAENELKQKQEEKAELEKQLEEMKAKQKELEARIAEAEQAVNEAQAALDEANDNADEASRALEDAQNEYDARLSEAEN